MKVDQLLDTFMTWGLYTKPEYREGFKTYLAEMLRRKRVMLISSLGGLEAVLTFFLTDDYNDIYKKSEWATPQDNPDGKQFYVDKVIAKNWNRLLRRNIADFVAEMYPQVESYVWHRPPYDRLKIVPVRRELCTA